MPAVDIAHQHLLTARAIHEADRREGKETFDILDWSGIIAGTRVAAGLDGFDSSRVSRYFLPIFNLIESHAACWRCKRRLEYLCNL